MTKIKVELDLKDYDLRMSTDNSGNRAIVAFTLDSQSCGIVVAIEKDYENEIGYFHEFWPPKNDIECWTPVDSIEFPEPEKFQWLYQNKENEKYHTTRFKYETEKHVLDTLPDDIIFICKITDENIKRLIND